MSKAEQTAEAIVRDLKWRGCGEGSYVSHDGLFLVAQVTTSGKKGPRQQWALYGRVNLRSEPRATERPAAPWRWAPYPLVVKSTKANCQVFASACSYEAPVEEPTVETLTASAEKGRGWNECLECGVRFDRRPGHRYEDYCGKECAGTAAERLMDILGNGGQIHDLDGRPVYVGAGGKKT